MKVLIVEDNHHVAETIADYLELVGIDIDCAYHGVAAIEILKNQSFDAIVMDIMMPKLDGISTVQALRNDYACSTPIIFLTAKDTLEDKIHAFEAGGDDYLVKPFAMEELHIRLLALSKRGKRTDVGKITFEDMEMDIKAGTLSRQQQLIKLAPIQLKIIALLMKKAPDVVSKNELTEHIWGDELPSSDALRSHLYTIRNAIDKGFDTPRLETIHGKGYRLK
ncbi:DNA-binding response regulator [Aliivibrio salmonicida]|uniref:Two-component system response regulator n=1 Tax=Aliivibrio salmonicida (strain LFI1238) TaxID=316275 RepID=B6ER42_ALISL|nr:response regulator transcription factor [Aliivibrio salmonicida]AZL86566.1 DNA-binding response regulator [Aliivibrio salmonicida]CAQ81172.1 two-component system response regulator [Aliivibrio salmonicida LFI1238]